MSSNMRGKISNQTRLKRNRTRVFLPAPVVNRAHPRSQLFTQIPICQLKKLNTKTIILRTILKTSERTIILYQN